ncbi:MAG: hypothetical protein K8S23_16665 [Candidatus Cloacimonetes bacterium]|nr:hypothetical protein [Candidatus Cloacimonadota bacterium]
MREVVLNIPTLEAEQNVEIDVRINGRKKTIKYRVEIISWEGSESDSEEKVTVLKHAIKGYNKDWELIQIGAPNKNDIPLMFRKKTN